MVVWIWATIALLTVVHILRAWIWKSNNKKMLPPGPRGFPIFGSLYSLGQFPNKDLHRLAQKYGDIMYLRLGLMPTIVVSSPQAAELFLKTHDLVFASRPPHEEAANNRHVAIDLSDMVSTLSVDMSCRMVIGKKYKDEEFDEMGFKSVIREGIQLAAAPNLGDYIPWIAPLDLQGFTKRMKVIGEHLQSKDEERPKDFVDAMVAFMFSEESDYRIERSDIKAILLKML
ncbi:unnamed protein product [Malus baccata var. baccata]